jgi:TPR repeat protein
MNHKGQGVLHDDAAAVRLYRKSADQGNAEGESGLGFMYYYGYGVGQDHAEAYRWFRKAADQGDKYAEQALAKRLTALNKVFLIVQGLFGIVLSLSFLSLNLWERTEARAAQRQVMVSGTGLLCLVSACFSWYGYSHYKIRCLVCGFNSFTWISWLLDGASLALLFWIVLSEKKARADENDTDASKRAASDEATAQL